VQQLFGGDRNPAAAPKWRKRVTGLIDGPKGYPGLRLALRLLANGNTPLVFLPDTAAALEQRSTFRGNMRSGIQRPPHSQPVPPSDQGA